MRYLIRIIILIIAICPFFYSHALATECNEIRECMNDMVELASDLVEKNEELEKKVAELEKTLLKKDEEALTKYKELLVNSFKNFKIGELQRVKKGETCKDGTVIVQVDFSTKEGGASGYVGNVWAHCAKLIIDVDG